MITNATLQEVNTAIGELNKRFEGNIRMKDRKQLSKNRLQFTITVYDSKKIGSKRSYHMLRSKPRRVSAACWHVHGYLFEELFKINPSCFVRTSLGRYKHMVTEEQGNWVDMNVGSYFQPVNASEACNCAEFDE
jgi:hypothetical protein